MFFVKGAAFTHHWSKVGVCKRRMLKGQSFVRCVSHLLQVTSSITYCGKQATAGGLEYPGFSGLHNGMRVPCICLVFAPYKKLLVTECFYDFVSSYLCACTSLSTKVFLLVVSCFINCFMSAYRLFLSSRQLLFSPLLRNASFGMPSK